MNLTRAAPEVEGSMGQREVRRRTRSGLVRLALLARVLLLVSHLVRLAPALALALALAGAVFAGLALLRQRETLQLREVHPDQADRRLQVLLLRIRPVRCRLGEVAE